MYTSKYDAPDTDRHDDVEQTSPAPGRKITAFLRWCGSILVVFSAASFLIQGHEDMLPAYRYWITLAFTLLLCGCGLVCAYAFRETKGTRIFFALATGFMAVQVSQVSAMLHGYLFSAAEPMSPLLGWWQFDDISLLTVAVNLLVTLGVLIPVVYAGFTMLARRRRGALSGAFYLGNALLLLPLREPGWMAVLLAGLLLFLRHNDRNVRDDSTMKLAEGIAARAIVWIPALIMLGRSLLYPGSFLLDVTLLGFAALWLIRDIHNITRSPILILWSQALGTVGAVLAWLAVAQHFEGVFAATHAFTLLPIAALMFLLADTVVGAARLYRSGAALIALTACFLDMQSAVMVAPVLTMAVGIALGVAGLKYREKVPFLAGMLCFVGGLLYYAQYAVVFYQASPWLSSIALGLGVLLLASYIENKEKVILQKTKYYFNELKSWN